MNEIKIPELRVGNLLTGKESGTDKQGIVKVVALDSTGEYLNHPITVESAVEEDNSGFDCEFCDDLEPLLLTDIYNGKTWLQRCGYGDRIKVYPKYVKYVHELQNWHYWWNNKIEIKIDL